jgi:hypothetical protein
MATQALERTDVMAAPPVRLIGMPLERSRHGVMIKPGELVDIVEISPLNLIELRVYNQLIANAWPRITEAVVHKIRKADLKGTHESNDRLKDSIRTLMRSIAEVKVIKDGEPGTMEVQLLGANIKHDRADGYFYYKFPEELLQIFQRSEVFAKLKTRIMYAFTSKYALRLYEVVQKRVNLDYLQYEEFTVEEFRNLLGVPKGKLGRVADFNKHALKPALEEVNFLGDYLVEVRPVKQGRRLVRFRLFWLKKDTNGLAEAWKELNRHRIGRRARMRGAVETADGAAN